LVLQTVLPALLTATGPSFIRISGGTHNKAAPPLEFLTRAFLPLLNRMGPTVTLRTERGARRNAYAESFISGIPKHVADRELAVVAHRLNWAPEQLLIRGVPGEMGPGNALALTLEYEHKGARRGARKRRVRGETSPAVTISPAGTHPSRSASPRAADKTHRRRECPREPGPGAAGWKE
jgi:RNA 3'-terminal phosphate cyclase